MAVPYRQSRTGTYVPTTFILDVAHLQDVDVTKPEFKELLIRLYQNMGLVNSVLNLKETGYYLLEELVNSQSWFPNPALTSSTGQVPTVRQDYRKVINFGQLPNAGLKSVAHGITVTNQYTFTRIYACASDTTGFNYIPIPYASPVLVNNIELSVDATNVNITTGSNRTNFNICYVILEMLKL